CLRSSENRPRLGLEIGENSNRNDGPLAGVVFRSSMGSGPTTSTASATASSATSSATTSVTGSATSTVSGAGFAAGAEPLPDAVFEPDPGLLVRADDGFLEPDGLPGFLPPEPLRDAF